MKRSTLALLIPALLVAGAANAAVIYNQNGNKLDLYGKVQGENYIAIGGSHKTNDPANTMGDQSYFRIGIKGSTQISDQLTGFGRFEYEKGVGKGADSETRYGYAGLKFGNWGSLSYGRNDGVAYDIMGYTDIAPDFGSSSSSTDLYMTGRANSVATYHNNNFFGLVKNLDLTLQYQDKNKTGANKNDNYGSYSGKQGNGDGYGASLQYTIDNQVTIGAAFTNSAILKEANNPFNTEHAKRADMYAFGVKYNANNFYLAAIYTLSHNLYASTAVNTNEANGLVQKARTYELAASYTMDLANGASVQPFIGYFEGKNDSKNLSTSTNKDLFKYYELGAKYNFNSNMSAAIDYKLNRVKNQKDTLGLNLTYSF